MCNFLVPIFGGYMCQRDAKLEKQYKEFDESITNKTILDHESMGANLAAELQQKGNEYYKLDHNK